MTRQQASLHFQNLNRPEYFEGWYYKQVSADEQTILACIPSMARSKGKAEAFLQMNVARLKAGTWHVTSDVCTFPISDFSSNVQPFSLKVGASTFSDSGIDLNFWGEDIRAQGVLEFHESRPLPTSLWSPTIMGPFSYLPKMECIHSVISLDHVLTGQVRLQDTYVDFTGGRGYIEKDWGSSFPEAYIWTQSNHFNVPDTGLFFSWARIPFLKTAFKGFICHVFIGDRHFRFATYTGARCTLLKQSAHAAHIRLSKGKICLDIKVEMGRPSTLRAPIQGEMRAQIKEGLTGTLDFELTSPADDVHVQAHSERAGIEIVNL